MKQHRHWTGVLLVAAFLWGAARPSSPTAMSPGRQGDSPAPIWHIAGEGRGRPLLDGGAVYFLSKRHQLLAVDAASGVLRWTRETGEPGEATMGTSIVATGSVVVAGDYNLVAFARDGGAVRWRFVPRDGYGPGIYLGAAADGVVYAGSPAGRLYAVDGESGVQRWSSAIAAASVSGAGALVGRGVSPGVQAGLKAHPAIATAPVTVFAPMVDRDQVVAAYTTFSAPNAGGVVAYDRATGTARWRTDFPHDAGSGSSTAAAGSPIVADDLVIAASTNGVIHAMDRGNGRIRWSIPAVTAARAGTPVRDFRPLAAIGRTLVAGSLTGCAIGYDLNTHEERWRYCDAAGASIAFAIGADERTVYAPYYEGRLVAIDAVSGAERWHLGGGPDTGFNWLPAADGDRLYVAASTAGFFGLRRQ